MFTLTFGQKNPVYGRCNQELQVKVLQIGMFSVSQLSTIPIHNRMALTSVLTRVVWKI